MISFFPEFFPEFFLLLPPRSVPAAAAPPPPPPVGGAPPRAAPVGGLPHLSDDVLGGDPTVENLDGDVHRGQLPAVHTRPALRRV